MMKLCTRMMTILLLAGWNLSAHALLIDTSIGKYDVFALPLGSYTDQITTLDDQPWWEDSALSLEFASLVAGQLGVVNFGVNGPYFATGDAGGSSTGSWWSSSNNTASTGILSAIGNDRIYAAANRVPASVPVPATLALFGLGLAGLGWSRRRKA